MTSKKGTARKEEIIRTAGEIFAQKGIRDTSVNDIVGRMNIAKGTFYHYFSSKEELATLFVDRLCSRHLEEIRTIIEQDGLPFFVRLRECLLKFFGMASSPPLSSGFDFPNPELMREDWVDRFVQRMAELLGAFMWKGKQLGFVGVKDPYTITMIVSVGVQGLWRKRLAEREPVTRQEFSLLLSAVEEMFHLPAYSLSEETDPGCPSLYREATS